jgi:hypothetical protein
MWTASHFKYVLFVLQLYAGDGLPAQVCQQCVHQVNNFYNFKLLCESSDFMLRQYLSTEQSDHQSCQVSAAVVIIVLLFIKGEWKVMGPFSHTVYI